MCSSLEYPCDTRLIVNKQKKSPEGLFSKTKNIVAASANNLDFFGIDLMVFKPKTTALEPVTAHDCTDNRKLGRKENNLFHGKFLSRKIYSIAAIYS